MMFVSCSTCHARSKGVYRAVRLFRNAIETSLTKGANRLGSLAKHPVSRTNLAAFSFRFDRSRRVVPGRGPRVRVHVTANGSGAAPPVAAPLGSKAGGVS